MDILIHIYGFLPMQNFSRVKMVNRKWYNICITAAFLHLCTNVANGTGSWRTRKRLSCLVYLAQTETHQIHWDSANGYPFGSILTFRSRAANEVDHRARLGVQFTPEQLTSHSPWTRRACIPNIMRIRSVLIQNEILWLLGDGSNHSYTCGKFH